MYKGIRCIVLAAHSTQALSTALVMLGTHIILGAQGQTKVPQPGIEPATY